MCTTTVIPLSKGGYRLARNRDAQRNHPAASRPEIVTEKGVQIIYPVDPTTEGGWISVNEAGLCLDIMGSYADDQAHLKNYRKDFGVLIPRFAHHATAAEALEQIRKDVKPGTYGPFSMLCVDGRSAYAITSDGQELKDKKYTINRCPMFTCSTLGNKVVQQSRKNLYDAMLRKSPTPAKQDAFHAHQWPSQPHLSVCMERDDARTVSLTVVTMMADSVSMLYHDGMPNRNCPESELVIPKVSADAVV